MNGLLEKASVYVDRFEKDFAVVLGDESYEQKSVVTRRPGRGPSVTSRDSRKTRSEILFVWASRQQWWLVVRNVMSANGRPVAAAGTLAQVFAGPNTDPMTELRRIRADSARFNLGNIYRDFNDPTLALQFVSSRHRDRFHFGLSTRSNDSKRGLFEVNFTEGRHPTLLSGPDGDLPVSGSFLVHGSDGTILRSHVSLSDAISGTRAEIRVTYQRDKKLARWVPARMQESYQQLLPEEGPLNQQTIVEQRIDCVASYSNFRRFETSGRIIVPPDHGGTK